MSGPTREEMLKYMEEASRLVASWPEWKRNVLGRTVAMRDPVRITKGDFVKDSVGNEWFVVETNDKIIVLMNLYGGGHWHASIYEPLTVIPTTTNQILRLQACHQRRVGTLMNHLATHLTRRAVNHDASKWQDAELIPLLSIADRYNRTEYGSEEYNSLREQIAPAIAHHEKANRHHLGHFNGDISRMNMLDIQEMLCDWMASSEKNGGDVYNALAEAKAKYNWSDDLYRIMVNTLDVIIYG